jgi:hypothetical protein
VGSAADSLKKLTDVADNTTKKLKNVQHEHAFELQTLVGKKDQVRQQQQDIIGDVNKISQESKKS